MQRILLSIPILLFLLCGCSTVPRKNGVTWTGPCQNPRLVELRLRDSTSLSVRERAERDSLDLYCGWFLERYEMTREEAAKVTPCWHPRLVELRKKNRNKYTQQEWDEFTILDNDCREVSGLGGKSWVVAIPLALLAIIVMFVL